uniref:Uncharacterized protein n=1 Tax=Nelumbo nucifera TaxID=4432 RepID=A0A822XZF4_NELNU|nr:TPA_asm: hypothetical protein HUJ06_025840 [Nelumbo nucifera]
MSRGSGTLTARKGSGSKWIWMITKFVRDAQLENGMKYKELGESLSVQPSVPSLLVASSSGHPSDATVVAEHGSSSKEVVETLGKPYSIDTFQPGELCMDGGVELSSQGLEMGGLVGSMDGVEREKRDGVEGDKLGGSGGGKIAVCDEAKEIGCANMALDKTGSTENREDLSTAQVLVGKLGVDLGRRSKELVKCK